MFSKIFLLIICFVPSVLMAQNTFFKQYSYLDFESKKSVKIIDAIQLEKNYILFGEKHNDVSNERIYPITTFLNSTGELNSLVIDSTFYSAVYLKSCIKQNFIYATGVKYESFQVQSDTRKIITKYTLDGILIWSKTFGDSSQFVMDNSVINIFTTSNGFVVFASSNNGLGSTDGEATFFDDDGNVLFRKLYSTEESLHYTDFISNVCKQEDGYAILLESIKPDLDPNHPYLLLKIDFEGNEIWRKDLTNFSFGEQNLAGLVNNPYCISSYKNNSTAIIFTSENDTGSVSKQLILAEFDFEGNLLRSSVCLNDSNDYTPYDLRYDEKQNELFLFGAKAGEDTQFFDVSVVKFNSDFDVLWNKSWGYGDSEMYNGVSVLTSDGGILIGGSILRNQFPVGYDFFLVKTDCEGNIEWDSQSCLVESDEELLVIENPIKETLVLQFPSLSDEDVLEFELVNSLGQIVREKISAGSILTENIANLSVGMYLYRVHVVGGKTYVGKVIKQ